MIENNYLKMLRHLRRQEEIMLYGSILEISKEDEEESVQFLQEEYLREMPEYPFTAPGFDPMAASWAANTVYIAAQLMLYRENKPSELTGLLPLFPGEITPSAVLSADLCLRFFPDIIRHLVAIDGQDPLIPVLENQMVTWHYSGIALLSPAPPDLKVIISNKCLQQLYINRITRYKHIVLAKHPLLKDAILAGMGIFNGIFWKELKSEPLTNE